MAYSYNRATLIGRLGRDPELRYTAEGVPVATFRLATDRPAKAGAEPQTDWHQIVAWRALGEFAGEYLTKGRLVLVTGRLTYRNWEGRDGQRRWAAEVVASEIVLLDRRPEAAASEPASEGGDDVPF